MASATPEQRAEALRLYQAMEAARHAYGEGDESPEIEAITEKYAGLMRELRFQREAEMKASAAYKAKAEAEEAYENHPFAVETVWGDDGRVPMICAKSGSVILNGDEYITDDESGEAFLRSALGLPPRPDVEEEAEDSDIEEAA